MNNKKIKEDKKDNQKFQIEIDQLKQQVEENKNNGIKRREERRHGS